ncbi:MAG: hypothetical protein FVQ81_02745 [Candidatus Glassbacteria bacterium]|nr:hypothetical protein [Candidatus Glassbacteria bacterium]
MISRIIGTAMLMSLTVPPLPAFSAFSIEDLTVLDAPADTMMRAYLTEKVGRQFARRDSLLAGFTTKAQWERHADYIREKFREWTGPFPERSPLKARVAGVLQREGYRVEKLCFQSRPGFYVSASLYVPAAGSGPFPAVLYAVGHSIAGKAAAYVQPYCIAQARKGFVVMVIDAVGQGERRQEEYFVFGGSPGSVHQAVGFQAFLAGTHVFNLMVWDAIRALDYLESRPEVDRHRIGITGSSGGGMMSTYILPFENRIAAAVPACNPNTWLARVKAGLATDHEQVFFGAFSELVDPRGDPLLCLAPRPLLIDATSRDQLNPPMGVWALDSWLYRAWASYGSPEKIHTSMVDAEHAYNRDQREAAYAWFRRWLGDGGPAGFSEGELEIEPESLLWSAPDGSVFELPGSRDPHSLVLEYFQHNRARWNTGPGTPEFNHRVRDALREVTGIGRNPAAPAVEIIAAGSSDGVERTKLLFRPEPGIVLPAVLIGPVEGDWKKFTIYLNDLGKQGLAADSLEYKEFLEDGGSLLAADLRGQGETAPGLEGKFWDFLAGDPPPSQKIRDILAVLSWVKAEYPDVPVTIRAVGTSGLWAAIAAVLDGRVDGLYLAETPVDFADMLETKLPRYNEELILPGILARLDMQQVYQALCPLPVTLDSPLRADRQPAGLEFLRQRFAPVSERYASAGKPDNWAVKVE